MKFLKLSVLSALVILGLIASVILFYFFPDRNRATIYLFEKKLQTCGIARELAQADFAKGTYRIIRGGMPHDHTKNEVIAAVLKTDYNIEVIYSGCVGTPEMDCYTIAMGDLLVTKYGKNFCNEVVEKANKQYQLQLKGSVSDVISNNNFSLYPGWE